MIAEIFSTHWTFSFMLFQRLLGACFVENMLAEQFHEVIVLSFFCLICILYKILKTDGALDWFLEDLLSYIFGLNDPVLCKKPVKIMFIPSQLLWQIRTRKQTKVSTLHKNQISSKVLLKVTNPRRDVLWCTTYNVWSIWSIDNDILQLFTWLRKTIRL